MTNFIGLVNQKGGVGKTTTAVTLAHMGAQTSRKILVLDFDPPGHVAMFFRIERSNGLSQFITNPNIQLFAVVKPARRSVWIVPGNQESALINPFLESSSLRERTIKEKLENDPFIKKWP